MAENYSDEGIATRLGRGDEESWAHVVDVVLPKVREALRRRCGGGAPWCEGEAAVSSACRTIYRRLKEGPGFTGLASWNDLEGLLVTIARNKFVTMLRKSAREAEAMLSPRVVDVEGRAALDPIAPLLTAEVVAAMSALLDDLRSPWEQFVFRGKLDGLQESEIAARWAEEHGGARTRYMVRETWRQIRDRIRRQHADLIEDFESAGPVGK